MGVGQFIPDFKLRGKVRLVASKVSLVYCGAGNVLLTISVSRKLRETEIAFGGL